MPNAESTNILQASLDGSASWWTQGLGHANHNLTMAAAYAAGRYGHVMFPEAIHEPALSLAKALLSVVNNPRLTRLFYSDNGSTGTEVAIKMAMVASARRYGWENELENLDLIGLKGSYHGDTIGAMDMSEPSVFNQRVPWYRGRGLWFDVPTVKMVNGKWIIEMPETLRDAGTTIPINYLQRVYSLERDESPEALLYRKHIQETLEHEVTSNKRRFGALMMETAVLGAGGMQLVDPLFQRILVDVVRDFDTKFSLVPEAVDRAQTSTSWSGVPVVADEVFTGLYRLGHASSSTLVGIRPDISVHAKLLTGGLVPLAATLASEEIFEAFLGNSKADCLLHGHSYTAHPVGCEVARRTLEHFRTPDQKRHWEQFEENWNVGEGDLLRLNAPPVFSVWTPGFIDRLSRSEKISSVWALGTVLSISFEDEAGGGYTSTAARDFQTQLKKGVADSDQNWNVNSRVLGNVLYMMTSLVTKPEGVDTYEARILDTLGIM